jgi:hypothetical protein
MQAIYPLKPLPARQTPALDVDTGVVSPETPADVLVFQLAPNRSAAGRGSA